MQPQRVERHTLGQTRRDACGKVLEHVLARGLVVDGDDVAEARRQNPVELLAGLRGPEDERMVEARNDLLVDDAFQHAEVHHHAAFGVRRIAEGSSLHRDEKAIGVPVNLAARAVVTFERVCRLEGEFLGQSNYCHIAKIAKAERIPLRRAKLFPKNRKSEIS